jgi:antitoxin ParD1/3/4
MNVSLTPELEKFVSDHVRSGRYASASEVIREALRLLEEGNRLKRLQRDIHLGIEQLDRGRSRRFDGRAIARIKKSGIKRLAARNPRKSPAG